MPTFKVTKDCIGCRACLNVASDNFEIDDTDKVFVKKQPSNIEEELKCNEAVEICPVNAIISNEDVKITVVPEMIVASSNIKKTLDKHPQLKLILIELSPKFKRMQNPALYNTLARFANFNDAARMTGISVCEILHTMNKYLGIEEKLLKTMPECIKKSQEDIESQSVEITWEENQERYIYNKNSVEELMQKVSNLIPQNNIVILAVDKPLELLRVVKGLGFDFNMEIGREYRVSIFNPKAKVSLWKLRKDNFEILDVRTMTKDPFDLILKKAKFIEDDQGFILIQRFEPFPMINMLVEMGFEYLTEQKAEREFWIYLHKKVVESKIEESSSKIDVIIQSATPVAYPIIMRLLQSDIIREKLNIKEFKAWKETEKHLAWISNGKADISFSSLITSVKLINSDIKIPALFVWDNFVLLSRLPIEGLADLKGERIHTPLFEEAPPAKITKYLIEASGLNINDYKFVYGKPFGRPEEICRDFVDGKSQTVILREPEASYAIKQMNDIGQKISVLSYNKIWNEINPNFGSFPNAGLVLKGEFVRRNPEFVKIFMQELKLAILWVTENKVESAKQSFEMMNQKRDEVELFLDRVNFDFVDGEEMILKVKQYFEVLNRNKITNIDLNDEFLKIFHI